jgi:hypothetical protein
VSPCLQTGGYEAELMREGTVIQAGLVLWCTLSIAGAIMRFQPESQGMSPGNASPMADRVACKDSTCGWGIVAALVGLYILVQMWIGAVSPKWPHAIPLDVD